MTVTFSSSEVPLLSARSAIQQTLSRVLGFSGGHKSHSLDLGGPLCLLACQRDCVASRSLQPSRCRQQAVQAVCAILAAAFTVVCTAQLYRTRSLLALPLACGGRGMKMRSRRRLGAWLGSWRRRSTGRLSGEPRMVAAASPCFFALIGCLPSWIICARTGKPGVLLTRMATSQP
jgi:hypothetical protein